MKKKNELELEFKRTGEIKPGECPMTDGRPGFCGTCMYVRWSSDDDVATFCALNKK